MDKNIIKKIELDIDGVGITLTPEQAKKLHGALADLLGVKAEKEYVPLPQPYPVPSLPYTPYRPYRWEPLWVYSGTVTKLNNVTVSYCANSSTAKLSV